MVTFDVQSVTLGRNPTTSVRSVGGAFVLFVVLLSLLVVQVETPFDVFPLPGPAIFVLLGLLALGSAVCHAYRNSGVLVCIVLAVAPILSYYLPLTVLNWAYPSEDLLWGVGTSLMFGAPIGVLGFLLGVGGRWLVPRRRESHETVAQV